MKHIKKFNEGFLDNLEALVKGKSDKGKLLEEILKKQNLPLEGFGYTFRYMGGSDLTPEVKSHPFSYLTNYEPNKGKLKAENGKLLLTDETFNSKKVVNIISMLDKQLKDGEKMEEHGRLQQGLWGLWLFWSGLQSSAVIKFNYKFDLSSENPTLTFSNSLLFDIEKGTWVKNEKIDMDEVEILDGDINPETEKNLVDGLSGTIFNKELVTTYQIFIDECNKRKDIVDIMSKTITPKEVEVKERLRIKKFK